MELYNNDCLDIMNTFESESIDFVFCDLPYGQTSCSWDCEIDLEKFWKIINKITKKESPIVFTCSTKFGVSLINSNKKNFRYDLVWIKSSPCGFLNAKKMPMKKHEMIYVFYRKLPKIYTENIKLHHKHKFLEERDTSKYKVDDESCYGKIDRPDLMRKNGESKYDPPLPTSICNYDVDKNVYGGGKKNRIKISKDKKDHQQKYDPPLPTSVIKTEFESNSLYGAENKKIRFKNSEGKITNETNGGRYEPPLPTSVIKNEDYENRVINPRNTIKTEENYGKGYLKKKENFRAYNPKLGAKGEESHLYEPPLPNTILEIKSEKGKHPTQKPTELVKWLLKYYTKEGDIVLDPTMGSGTTGVACKEMNREFIGIEKDDDIFKVAESRLK